MITVRRVLHDEGEPPYFRSLLGGQPFEDARTAWWSLPQSNKSFTVSGTAVADYIHAAGDGNTPPPGYNEIIYAPVNNSRVTIFGGDGNDTIFAGIGKQYTFNGGAGQDTLIGQSRRDYFDYSNYSDSVAGSSTRDKIVGFGGEDVIRFIGSLSLETLHFGLNFFTGTAGEVIQYVSGTQTILAVDRNGDSVADFEVAVVGTSLLKNANLSILATTHVNGTSQNEVIHSVNTSVSVPSGYLEEAYIDPTVARDSISGAQLNGRGGDDIIYGSSPQYGLNNDFIDGGAGTDKIYAGYGDDYIDVDSPSDVNFLAEVMDGGAGTDYLQIATGGTYNLQNATITNIETLLLYGLTTLIIDPTKVSGLLSVTIESSAAIGSTLQLAAPGTFHINTPGVIYIVGSGGGDSLGAYNANGTSFDGGAGSDSIEITYATNVTILGGDDSDDISVSSHDGLYVDGGAGDDALYLGNVLFKGAAGVQAYGGSGIDFIVAGDGNDYLNGGTENDTLNGGKGDDVLIGGAGADQLTGSGGHDRFVIDQLGSDVDRITDFSISDGDRLDLSLLDGDSTTPSIQGFHFGGTSFTGSAGELIQFGTPGGEFTLEGDVNGDGIADFRLSLRGSFLTAGDIIDTVYGTNGSDAIVGGPANDIINGFDGADVLTGGQGQDVVAGGLGADTFVFRTLAGSAPGQYSRDILTDFSHAQSDRIDLSNIDADTTLSGNQAFHLAGSAFTATPGELIQSTGGGHTILSGDVNGDAVADFQIDLSNGVTLVTTDFVL